MAKKRKRSSNARDDQEPPSKRSTDHQARRALDAPTPRHPVLQQFYPNVQTLRAYVLSHLENKPARYRHLFDRANVEFSKFLDSTIVGSGRSSARSIDQQARVQHYTSFSQQLTESTARSANSVLGSSQTEIVDFVIWLLFRHYYSHRRPPHLLCHGFQRAAAAGYAGLQLSAAPGILGIQSFHPNQYVEMVKGPHWCQLLSLLGKNGDQLMIDLLLDCGIFDPANHSDNLSQICGTPLCDMKTLLDPGTSNLSNKDDSLSHPRYHGPKAQNKLENHPVNTPTMIRFVRHRMLYARPALHAKGNVRFGLPHIHVFNRYHELNHSKQTQYIMHHVFPRQYGLHNVFTSKMDPKETTHAFKDYTLREVEISAKIRLQRKDTTVILSSSNDMACLPLPKRLRGRPVELVARMRKFHARCSYTNLLQHYCPRTGNLDLRDELDPVEHVNFLSAATPSSHVSAFCRSVAVKVIPLGLWGDGEVAVHNRSRVLFHIDRFVRARKHESTTLHEVLEGLKIREISWLAPTSLSGDSKLSLTDVQKRKEVFMEFLYYVFDSFLIPLIRSNFYVTESNVNRNKLFYFRHDVWRKLAEPSISQLKSSMFDEIETKKAINILEKRPLPYSNIRLLPKQSGVRTISNLRKRIQRRQNGKLILGSSINGIMKPAFNVVKFEKVRPKSKRINTVDSPANEMKDAHEDNVGSSLFSVGDILPKLRKFQGHLKSDGISGTALYFAKVDVRACFDSIPQQEVMKLVEDLITADDYRIARHAEIRTLFSGNATDSKDQSSTISRKFVFNAYNGDDFLDLQDVLSESLSKSRTKTVFVDSVIQSTETKDNLLTLLSEHIERNIVKMGKKYYRQKNGIPQGSILSSLLCNLFYAQLEKKELDFARSSDCLLLRMIDDFLLISTQQGKAEKFLQIMHDGVPQFGVSIKPEKTLANFPAEINGFHVEELPSHSPFPYCGNLIDPQTLDISKDRERTRHLGPISDTLTVELTKTPGRTFQRKTLNALKIQMHGMFLDSSFNALSTVLVNLYHIYTETAQKCFAYIKSLPTQKQPSAKLLIKTVEDVIALSFALMSRRGRCTGQWSEYKCGVSKKSAQWLACTAFGEVFGQKQTRYQLLLAWLARWIAKSKLTAKEAELLTSVVTG